VVVSTLFVVSSLASWGGSEAVVAPGSIGATRGVNGPPGGLKGGVVQERSVEYGADGSVLGYARIPKIPDGAKTGDDGKLHIIFSSGCNYFQHWQSELLLASAAFVGQRGRITRIVSGCYDKKAEQARHEHQTFPSGKNDLLVPIAELNRSVNENFGLYITPAFDGAIDFPWINKPSSIDYFIKHARPELDRLGETVVAILDPDFLFLKPFTQVGEAREDLIFSRGVENDPGNSPIPDVAVKGRPVAQRYGLEGGWVDPKKYPLEEMLDEPNTPALKWTYSQAAKWTSVGPPLILHVDDLTPLSVLWERSMRPVLKASKNDILADMWAYSMSSAHLGLKHTTLDHWMISTWSNRKSGGGEAFEWVNAWDQMSCRNPPPSVPGKKKPTFIHMASNFASLDLWMFHKGHVPAGILSCGEPLIAEPPDDLFDRVVDERATSGGKSHLETLQSTWVLCHIISTLNRVLMEYKTKFCPVGFEQRKLVRLIQHKTKDRRCNEKRDKWCYPIAQIDGLAVNWRDSL